MKMLSKDLVNTSSSFGCKRIRKSRSHTLGLDILLNLILILRIASIPPTAFQDLHSLEWIKLYNNKLTTLHYELMEPVLDTLIHIDLHSETNTQQWEVGKKLFLTARPKSSKVEIISHSLASSNNSLWSTPDMHLFPSRHTPGVE